MPANSITEARVQKAIKKNAIKDTTAPLVFLVTLFVGFLIGYSLIKSFMIRSGRTLSLEFPRNTVSRIHS